MTRAEFFALLDRLADDWSRGDAQAVAAEFAETVTYGDPTRYRFERRADLLPFFEPPPDGHWVIWHRRMFDEAAQTGVAEYTYEGHSRYHGVVLAVIGDDGRVADWREWQHVSELDWDEFVAGPGSDPGSAGDA